MGFEKRMTEGVCCEEVLQIEGSGQLWHMLLVMHVK